MKDRCAGISTIQSTVNAARLIRSFVSTHAPIPKPSWPKKSLNTFSSPLKIAHMRARVDRNGSGHLFLVLAKSSLDYNDKSTPLFRTTLKRTGILTANGMTAGDIARMMKRKLRLAGLPNTYSPHSFRVTTITDLLSQGTPLEDVQNLAGHADPRTTRLYDRRKRKLTRNIVERISV